MLFIPIAALFVSVVSLVLIKLKTFCHSEPSEESPASAFAFQSVLVKNAFHPYRSPSVFVVSLFVITLKRLFIPIASLFVIVSVLVLIKLKRFVILSSSEESSASAFCLSFRTC